MTGNATDGPKWQAHIRNKSRREALARRFRDPADPFRIVIVRDMWLTGFDAPSLHTMYVDKPMHGHGLMQAIARVNRVFRDKPGGLVVDYLGLANELREALVAYTESGGRGKVEHSQAEAIFAMQREYEVCRGLFHGFDWSAFSRGSAGERVSVLPRAQEHILAQKDGKQRLLDAVYSLSRAFALAVPSDEAMAILDDVAFFQAVRSVLRKSAGGGSGAREDLDLAIRQIVSRAVASDQIIDIFAAAGLKKPDISILSDDFLAEVQEMPEKNLAVELLAKLLKGEIKSRSRRNVVEARSFEKMLEEAVRRYQNRAVETAQVIEELIALAKDMRARDARGEAAALSEDELAFYDALDVERFRRRRPRRRNPPRHRPRVGGYRQGQRHHRLDRARERPGPSPRPRQTLPPQTRLSARQASQSHDHRPRTSRSPLRTLGRGLVHARRSWREDEPVLKAATRSGWSAGRRLQDLWQLRRARLGAEAGWRVGLSVSVELNFRQVVNRWHRWEGCKPVFGWYPWPAEHHQEFMPPRRR